MEEGGEAEVERQLNASSTSGKRKQYIRLIHAGKMLVDKETLGFYGIKSGSFIHAAVSDGPARSHMPTATIAQTPIDEGPRRGFDLLLATNSQLSRDDITAIRAHFSSSVSQFSVTLPQQEGESAHDRYMRAEEEWMASQPANSEFRLNIQPLASLDNEDPTLGMEELMTPGIAGAEGTNSDAVWGFIMGFLLGFILLFWLFERSLPRRQKLGIIVGVGCNIIIGTFRAQ